MEPAGLVSPSLVTFLLDHVFLLRVGSSEFYACIRLFYEHIPGQQFQKDEES